MLVHGIVRLLFDYRIWIDWRLSSQHECLDADGLDLGSKQLLKCLCGHLVDYAIVNLALAVLLDSLASSRIDAERNAVIIATL